MWNIFAARFPGAAAAVPHLGELGRGRHHPQPPKTAPMGDQNVPEHPSGVTASVGARRGGPGDPSPRDGGDTVALGTNESLPKQPALG